MVLGQLALTCVLLAPGTAAAEELASTANLDGTYIGLGPVASALWIDGEVDGAFGGEASLLRIREHAALTAVGAWVGGYKYSERNGGRVWLELLFGISTPLVPIGVALGPTIEPRELGAARVGGQLSVWLFAGALPYVRVATFDRGPTVLEVGLRVTLPAIEL